MFLRMPASMYQQSSPLLRPGTPPWHIADRIVRARKGNPPQLQFSEMSPGDISATIELLVEANGLTDAFLLNAIDNRITHLVLTSCYHIRKYSLGMIPGQCHRLQSINLSNCRQADSKLVSSLLQGAHLTELILDGCVRVTDAAFLAQESPSRLVKLSLAGCRQISQDALLRLAKTCTSLEDLNLSGCRSSVSGIVLEAFLDQGKLKRIDLSDCAVLSSDDAFLHYQYKANLSNAFLSLEAVKIAGLSGLPPKYTHRTVGAIASMCGPNLVELDTTWCAGINDEACFALAIHCPNMQRLLLCNSSVTCNGVDLLVSHLKKLEVLDLSWCLKVGRDAVRIIALDAHNIHTLNLSHCVDFLDVGAAIRPDDIVQLVRTVPKLARLELGGIARLGTRELIDTLPFITQLSLSLASDAPIDSLSRLVGLTHLALDVSRIPSFAWPHFPNLIKLVLVGNPENGTVDSLLESVLSSQRVLEHLELRNCRSLTPTLFESWIKGYSPDRETTLLVEAMLDQDLARGYLSSATMVVPSDSEGGTVVFRGKLTFGRRKNKLISSCSETETNLGMDLLKNAIVLSDAARGMDNLRTLILTGACNLTDASLDRLSLMATYMQHLSVLDSPLITEEGAEPVKRRCKLLRSLELTGPKLRLRIDSSKFFKQRHRRNPPQKRKLSSDDDY